MRYAATTVGEREMPAEQWMRIFPVRSFSEFKWALPVRLARAASIIVQAASQTPAIDDDGESVRETRWYAMPSTCSFGVAPTLRTWVMEFAVRNDLEDAAEQGPRYIEGETREAEGWDDLSRLGMVEACRV
jgi:hypothetical protein